MKEMSPVVLLKNNSYVVGYKNGGHVLYKDGEIATREIVLFMLEKSLQEKQIE